MNDSEIVAASIADLISGYRQSAMVHTDAIASGRHRVANREFQTLTKLAREIYSRGSEGKAALADLFLDDEVGVRVWAATHSLSFAAASAEAVLAEAANGPASPTRLVAEQTLIEWRAGRLSKPE